MSDKASPIWRERLRSPLTWHYVGFAVLLVVVIGLGIRVGLDWKATNGHSNDMLAGKAVELKAMQVQTAPLRGLDTRVEETRKAMRAFYEKRIPPDYSTISGRIAALGVASGVRLTRVQYAQGKAGPDLTEITMEAGLTGDYTQIMHFINSLERDQTFFLIRSMALAGQQGGQVNLRLTVSTWLRHADAEASGLPTAEQVGAMGGTTQGGNTQGAAAAGGRGGE
jgi:Tfp pilus assembly protein PilO